MSEPAAAYDPPARIRALPSWLLGQAARTAERLVAEQLAAEGLRRQHYAVLTSLAEQGPASQAELGRRLWIDRSDLHAIVADLEAAGLLERSRDAGDRRRNLVAVTPAGTQTLERLHRGIDRAQAELLAPLSEADRRRLTRLLEQLLARG